MNLQNIPSHEKSIRMMFKAGYTQREINKENNQYIIPITDDVLIPCGWKSVKNLHIGGAVVCNDNINCEITGMEEKDNKVYIKCEQNINNNENVDSKIISRTPNTFVGSDFSLPKVG